jgi:hypothetical protein
VCVQEEVAEEYVLSEVEEVLEAGEMCITKGLAICNMEWA